MSCRKNLIIVVLFGVAVFISVTTTPSLSSAQPGRSTGSVILPFSVVDSSSLPLRGQDESVGKKSPNLIERLKRTLSNLTRDDTDDSTPDSPPREKVQDMPRPQAIPTTPPKPVTAQEVREAYDHPNTVTEKRPSTTPTQSVPKTTESARDNNVRDNNVRENITEVPRSPRTADAEGTSDNASIYDRMRLIREPVFYAVSGTDETTSTPTAVSKTPAPARTTPNVATTRKPRVPATESFPERSVPTASQLLANETGTQPTLAANANRRIAVSTEPVDDPWDPNDAELPPPEQGNSLKPQLSGIDVVRKPIVSPGNRTPTRQTIETLEVSAAARPGFTTQESARQQATFAPATDQEKTLLVCPLIELETIAATKAIVGQEAAYKIRVINRGGAPAEQFALTVEIPNWINVLAPEASAGTTSIVSRGIGSEMRDFVWKIPKVDAKMEEQIILNLVPQKRETVDLKIRYDFYKPPAMAKIVVQEPTLEMELVGPGEALWGTNVIYKLLIRNTGNGDAENVKLELLQTGSDLKSLEIPLLKAGEEQIIDIDVRTGLKQEHIDINVQATGSYGLTASAIKRVVVMRPELDVLVEVPDMLFVGNPAEFTVRVRNNGNATAKNVELAASIPLGARYISNTTGGQPTPQNQVLWNLDAIPSGGEFITTVVCEIKREGICKLEVVANDKSGLAVAGVGSVNVEAIADLKMQMDNPQGPVEVGQEAVFAIHITNRGTKTAEDVEVVAAFARGLEPFGIDGANGTMSDGQVIFDKIPTIIAGQTVTLKVKGRADRPGNHRVRVEVICQTVNAHIVSEQATHFYQKQKTRAAFTAESPEQPLTIQHTTTPQPLQSAPTTAASPSDPLR